jgi:hypothetical protein
VGEYSWSAEEVETCLVQKYWIRSQDAGSNLDFQVLQQLLQILVPLLLGEIMPDASMMDNGVP